MMNLIGKRMTWRIRCMENGVMVRRGPLQKETEHSEALQLTKSIKSLSSTLDPGIQITDLPRLAWTLFNHNMVGLPSLRTRTA